MSLAEYRRKRNEKLTPEPFEDTGPGRRKPIFVVQRHDARRLHYDFRLERNGVLASWAVPKGIPLEPGVRALAVHVEDHPLSYATFSGEIPKGQYGAGSVEIWDNGVYDLLEEKPNGQLTVRLEGERLNGVWSLVPARLDGKEQNWLLLMHAGSGVPARSYSPMLATPAEQLPSGDGWLFEVKFDGYRALAHVRGGEARLLSRTDNDLTPRFKGVAAALVEATKGVDAVIDGEVCGLDAAGRSSFSVLQQGNGPVVFYAFDLLELAGEPLLEQPLVERRERLNALLGRGSAAVRLSYDFDDGPALLAAAKEQQLEGVIAKRASSPYASGRRTRDWLKIKLLNEEEFVVAGYTAGSGRRSGTFGALVLAVNAGDELRYVGNVGTGFTDSELDRLAAMLRPLERTSAPFPAAPAMPRVRKGEVHWVDPSLVVEVRFSEWTHDGRLRQPRYVGLREDKRAADVTRDQ